MFLVDPVIPEPGVIAEATRALRTGLLVAFPTETVYGLGGRVFDLGSLSRIFRAKGRPTTHPLIAHVDGISMARGLSSRWDERAEELASLFWPGPLTLVVPRSPHVPAEVAGGGESIALRAPDHPVALALIASLGEPIAAPSANRYQSLSPTRAEHVLRSLGDAVDLVLDGGACCAGIESTVLDLRGDRPRVLRPGALSFDALAARLPSLELAGPEPGQERASPGLDPRHYAPRASVVLAPASGAAPVIERLLGQGLRVGALVCQGAVPSAAIVVRLPSDPEGYARGLFAALHSLDQAGVSHVVVERVPETSPWLAIADRLARASHPWGGGRPR